MPYKDPEVQRKYMREWIAKRRADWLADKQCIICGSLDRIEIDHIDPALKVSHNVWSWSESRREAELAKCQVLCHEHHLEKTAVDRRAALTHGTYAMRNTMKCGCEECKEYVRRDKRKSRARIALRNQRVQV